MLASDTDHIGLAAGLTQAVREAGALALRTFNAQLKHWTKGKDSPVSEADIAVDRLLRERLLALGPDYGWLSEETEDNLLRLSAHRLWVVDPIDGTRAYIAGLPDWTISVALVESGRPVMAAVYAPVAEEFFFAAATAGATCNDRPITVSAGEGVRGARIAGPRRTIDRLLEAEPEIVIEPRIHSLALRFARVAQGRLDAALAAGNSHDWDLAAADLLVHEADGALTTLAGERLIYNRSEPRHGPLIAAGRSRHRALSELLRERQI